MAADRKKVSKASVHYRKSDRLTLSCGNCAMYHAGTCNLVKGKIEPSYLCDKWVRRARY